MMRGMEKEKQWCVALYSRVSTKCGKQDVENQLQQLREFCRRQRWKVVREFVDQASGKRNDRAAFRDVRCCFPPGV